MPVHPIVPRLHLITNRHLCGDRPLAAVVAAAARGGLGAVQLREKDLSPTELRSLACDIRQALGDTLLIINTGGERGVLDIIAASGATGAHLPGDAGPVADARAALGPAALIGRSVHSLAEAQAAEAEGADYLILGTIFATASKPGRTPAGLALVTEVARAVDIPVIAIGGIDTSNVGATLRAGAWGVAVMSTVLAAPDPSQAVEQLRQIIEQEVA
jgi:thiamine-phosphate diphosphorylase